MQRLIDNLVSLERIVREALNDPGNSLEDRYDIDANRALGDLNASVLSLLKQQLKVVNKSGAMPTGVPKSGTKSRNGNLIVQRHYITHELVRMTRVMDGTINRSRSRIERDMRIQLAKSAAP